MERQMSEPLYWAVMKAYPFSSLTIPALGGRPLETAPGEPQRFIPLFATRAEAVKFAGSEENVYEMEATKK